MIEHEKKFRVTNVSSLVKEIRKLGFKGGGTTNQKDTYYSRPDIDFMITKECLRIRTNAENLHEITYKPPTTKDMKESNAIWKREINIHLDSKDLRSASELLFAIGCKELCVVNKKRSVYKKGNITLAIDHIEGLGDFIEVEILSSKEDQNAIRQIDKLADQLDIDSTKVVKLPYRDLLMRAVQ